MGFIVQKVLLSLILPPASLLLIILSGLALLRRRRTAGRIFLAIGIVLLYTLSLDAIADRLIRPLEAPYKPFSGKEAKADAVVVLGAGANDLSWLPSRPEPTPSSLQRLVEGVRLARNLHLPLVLSGGSGAIPPTETREADTMADCAVKHGFSAQYLVVEKRSRNTRENAEQVKGLVTGRTIILVTSAFHLKRSAGMFKKQGFSVIPAPAGYRSSSRPLSITAFIPSAGALDTSSTALAEYLSLAWYWSAGEL
jgi:uncharacterized SAM-binding protein YcdF (DUF218 family)